MQRNHDPIRRGIQTLARTWLGALLLATAPAATAHAATLVVDYDGAATEDFQMAPYSEDGATLSVTSGHYEVVADAAGADGDHAFQVDEQNHGLSRVTLQVDGPLLFDALSLEIVNPAETAGEVTIAAVGGGGGSISAPVTAGTLQLGPSFQGITALVITQNAAGAFAFDDVTLETLPEPARLPSLLAASLVLLALRRIRRA